ncbi:MAG: HNH endonuclease [Prevotella sp.]|nr:HNH endonuclease [Prevotella sp.]
MVRNRRGEAVRGFEKSRGYLRMNVRMEGVRHELHLHHVVWVLCHGRLPSQIDHLNGNPRDNRIENLRETTQSENDANRLWTWHPNAKTGLPGVNQLSDRDKRFSITVGGREYRFYDRYEAFHALILLGRMFKAV